MAQVNWLRRVLFIYTKFSLILKRREVCETKKCGCLWRKWLWRSHAWNVVAVTLREKKRKMEMLIRKGPLLNYYQFCLLWSSLVRLVYLWSLWSVLLFRSLQKHLIDPYQLHLLPTFHSVIVTGAFTTLKTPERTWIISRNSVHFWSQQVSSLWRGVSVWINDDCVVWSSRLLWQSIRIITCTIAEAGL